MLSRLTTTATKRIPRHVGGMCAHWAAESGSTKSTPSDFSRRTVSSSSLISRRSAAPFSTTAAPGDDQQQSSEAAEGPTSLLDKSDKNIFQKFFDRHSISKQTNRILIAESFLQAAITQASDP